MNEGLKTGVFWIVSALMLAVGLFMSWPRQAVNESAEVAGKPLFEKFKDPLTASSLKIVTFDEEQGQVDTFEVRRDRESGQWTIPSRKGYPADAVEQMKDAANALVGLNILDVQTEVAEDHEALGVVEPKLEELEVGDVGVGRLVTFKNESQDTLASLIIGNPVKDEEGKVYVRKPGQDPVYVVELDESALSTKFQDWIEDDLLKLSSIDIAEMTIKDYSASMSGRGISYQRQYTANVGMNGPDWVLNELLEYPSDNPLADPKQVEIAADMEPNKDKLNDIKNALDDLKIVDVARKPDGMSANLRADKDLVSDNEALQSLAARGFFPVQMGGADQFEVLSANGELNVTINDGVEYVLRFGNVSGLSDEEDEETDEADEDSESTTGVNRYLLVTTRVDEGQFPAPELKPVPQTIEELAALLGVEAKPEPEQPQPSKEEMKPAEGDSAAEPAKEAEKSEESSTTNTEDSKEEMKADESKDETAKPEESSSEKPAEEKPAEEKQPETKSDEKVENPKSDSEAKAESESTEAEKEVEISGAGEASGTGQGAEDDKDKGDEQASDEKPADDKQPEANEGNSESEPADDKTEAEPATEKKDDEVSFADLSDDEKQERLEAEQEKILKENTRLLDQRKEKLNEAKRKVSDLNARFANWYYVIPEDTYSKLRISRDELLVKKGEETPAEVPAAP